MAVSLGEIPSGEALGGIPRIDGEGTEAAQAAIQAASMLSLLQPKGDTQAVGNQTRVWLGEGLGSVPRKIHEKMMRWEFVDIGELRPRDPMERVPTEADTQKWVVLPGFEVAQARKKPVVNIITWMHCYARYTAAMAAAHPTSTRRTC